MKLFSRNIPLAFKGTSFLGWKTHVFLSHAVWSYKDPWDLVCHMGPVSPGPSLSLVSPKLSPSRGCMGQATWSAPVQSQLPAPCSVPCPFPSGDSKRNRGLLGVMWRSRPPWVLGTHTQVPPAGPPALTGRGGSVTKPSHLKHSFFDRCLFEKSLSFYLEDIFQNKNE